MSRVIQLHLPEVVVQLTFRLECLFRGRAELIHEAGIGSDVLLEGLSDVVARPAYVSNQERFSVRSVGPECIGASRQFSNRPLDACIIERIRTEKRPRSH